MELPEKAQQAISYCHQQMLSDTNFNLLLKDRLAIYQAIDEVGNTPARKIYTCLAIISVRKVLPIWLGMFQNANLIEDRLSVAEKLIFGAIESEELDDKLNDFEYDSPFKGASSKVINEWMQSRPYQVYKAADATVWLTVSKGKPWQSHPMYRIQKGWEDERAYDPSSYAVVAYSGRQELREIISNTGIVLHAGGLADPNFSPTKRREFWEWWLNEAIAEAWRLAYSNKSSIE